MNHEGLSPPRSPALLTGFYIVPDYTGDTLPAVIRDEATMRTMVDLDRVYYAGTRLHTASGAVRCLSLVDANDGIDPRYSEFTLYCNSLYPLVWYEAPTYHTPRPPRVRARLAPISTRPILRSRIGQSITNVMPDHPNYFSAPTTT